MALVTISGHSDDIVQIEGAILDEFYPGQMDDETFRLAFSDGTVLSVNYDNDGIWRINALLRGTAALIKTEGDEDSGTDLVSLDGDIKWALGGKAFARAK